MEAGKPPRRDEFEFTLLGPGYGESIVLHVGEGFWAIVDSCIDRNGNPRALQYLNSIGVDPSEAVRLIVATHWHDDHIRGIAKLVEYCGRATFCCSSVLCKHEFLTIAHALEGRSHSLTGSGVREIHGVISRLLQTGSIPSQAIANRRIYVRGQCEIWSLSPDDRSFQSFLRSIGRLVNAGGQIESSLTDLTPNAVAVALWVRVNDFTVLLGSDVDKRGWTAILQTKERPTDKASVFKIPHHGSASAYLPEVWDRMLDPDPIAVLTPWRRGGRGVPNDHEVRLVLSRTDNAYATARSSSSKPAPASRSSMVKRTIREAGVKIRRLAMSPGAIRIRYTLGSQAQPRIKTFGEACHLKNLVQM